MEIAILIARIILLILGGLSASEAVGEVSSVSGESFSKLWRHLPSKYK